MLKKLLVYLQFLLPKHLLSVLAGYLANAKTPWLKNLLITRFVSLYQVDMTIAEQPNPTAYASFNDFFIRRLNPALRPIPIEKNIIVSPADGCIAQAGTIRANQLLQAKGMYFTLKSLFGGDINATAPFIDGSYATLYLAPHNYHRVHMPFSGKLDKTIYIPGRLFSVNAMTSSLIPNLYARNERLICLFSTEKGPMAIVLIGAMIVGSLQTVWMHAPIREKAITVTTYSEDISLKKGDEMGHFKLGSTVIVLFEKNRVEWVGSVQKNAISHYGDSIGLSIP